MLSWMPSYSAYHGLISIANKRQLSILHDVEISDGLNIDAQRGTPRRPRRKHASGFFALDTISLDGSEVRCP